MWYFAAVAGIVVAGAFAGFARSRGTENTGGEGPVGGFIDSMSMKALTMDQLDFMLARLEREDPPEYVYGAMCYEMMAPPLVAEYVCPVCGEKTLYENDRTAFIEWELQGARRLAESIENQTEFTVILDETQFCDYCSPETVDDPSLVLRVIPDEGEEIVNTVSLTDLRMLDSFLHGNLYWVTDNDAQLPLKEHAERLRELLGLTVR